MFDYAAAAKRARISEEDLARLVERIGSEFASDQMMAELHILRAILSIERGDASLEEVFHPRAAA